MTLARPVEVELKYRVASDDVGERILDDERLGELAALHEARTAHHEDQYFDTAAGALRAAGYAARLRKTDDGMLVTMKGLPTANGALHRRDELEAPATVDLDPVRWPPSDARALVIDLVGGTPLVELVRIGQTRRRREYGDAETTVEVSLDDVEVARGDTIVDRYQELEVELISGRDAALEAIAEQLGGIEGLTPSRASKLDAALTAIGASGSALATPEPAPEIEPEPAPRARARARVPCPTTEEPGRQRR